MENYTLFLNYFNKTPELMKKQLELVLKQSHQPMLVMACFLGVKNSLLFKEYTDFVRKNNLKNWKYTLSNHDFKYIGRYQLAINIPTDYVVMLDDDRLPSEDFCKKMVKIAKEKNCIVSQYGWELKKDENGTYRDMLGSFISPNILLKKDIRKILIDEQKNLLDADYLCGGMVFHKKHLVHLFKEPILTDKTGEDIMFCLSAKQAGIKVLIYLPFIDGSKNDMLGHEDDGISSTLASENAKKINKMRTLLINKYKQ